MTMDTARNRIREIRVGQGLSLQQLADRVGASKPQIDKLEKGARRLTPEWQERVAKALGVSQADLLGERPHPARPVDTRKPVLDTPKSVADTIVSKVDTAPDVVSNREPGVSRIVSAASVPEDLPLRGFGRIGTQGQTVGVLVDAAEAPEWVWRPAPLTGLAEAYAVRMPDSTMIPRYQPGQLLFVHPYRTPGPGDAVVVRLTGRRFLVGLLGRDPGGLTLERLAVPGHLALPRAEVLGIERVVLSEEP